jgi:glycine cleavage system H protein
MNVPDGLKYSTDHEWIQVIGQRVRVGITDYAQDALGDVVYAQLPALGDTVAVGDSFGEVESTKSVSDIYAPVAGVVVAINDLLDADPALLNGDPYGQGWLCEIEYTAVEDLGKLLTPEAYRSLTES